MSELDPLDQELARLFQAEARFPDEPAESKARVRSRVEASIALTPPLDGASPMNGASSSSASVASAGMGKLVTVATTAFLAGSVFGASVYHSLRRDPEPVIIEVPAPDPILEAPTPEQLNPSSALDASSAEATPEPSITPPIEPHRPARTSRREEPAPRVQTEVETSESQLARERAIIDVARAAIARGRASSALSAIDRHAADFPRGQLTEEREGLRIIALVQAGRREEAQSRANQFRTRYPRSLLHSAIESALRTGD